MKLNYPKTIETTDQLNELLSVPTDDVVEKLSNLDGDFIILGAGGKIGPSLARMAKRASKEGSNQRKIIGVSLFESDQEKKQLEDHGIETIHGNIMDRDFLNDLPDVKNVIFMVGMKFGSVDNLPLTWAVNSHLPALVAERYKDSRIVAYSTGCVYPLVKLNSSGSLEDDAPEPLGEYAQSCLGRERMFQYFSNLYKTPVTLIRLTYAVEMRYGVLVDIALKVKNKMPVDVSMGYFNVIWQGDANAMVLQSFAHCESPAKILNITGPELIPTRWAAGEFGKLFGVDTIIESEENDSALISNATQAHQLFGYPRVTLHQLIHWIAGWIEHDRPLLNKPTHFETRDGKY